MRSGLKQITGKSNAAQPLNHASSEGKDYDNDIREVWVPMLIALFAAIVLATTMSCAPVEPGDDTMMVLSKLTSDEQIMTLGVVRGSFDTGSHDDRSNQ